MKIYLLDDDRTVKNILKLIVTERELGTVCGMSDNGADALEDLPILKPDIVIVDLLMEGMDGISFVKQAKEILPEAAYIMLSQVSSKDMIAAAYEAGVEFFIQKPINSVEVETVIKKVGASLSLKRTMSRMQNIFMEGMQEGDSRKPETVPADTAAAAVRRVLQQLGIIGDTGSRDIILVTEYLIENGEQIGDQTLDELCGRFTDSPKSMEQRIRRTANAGLVNLAHLGIEDYGNEIFTEYSNTLYNFEQVRREMDYIRGKSARHGNVKIKSFLNALVVCSTAR